MVGYLEGTMYTSEATVLVRTRRRDHHVLIPCTAQEE